jgi:hypothetical protein
MKIAPIDQTKLAKTGDEYLALLASNADWIVRTADDVRLLRWTGKGALAKVPSDDFHAFLGSLEFKRGGVAHGSYRPLMASLTITEIFEVLSYFGMGRGYAIRILEYSCTGGDCSFDFWGFCSSACTLAPSR